MIEGLKPYPKYRESGVPWIGRIPSGWKVVRNGNLFGQRNQTDFGHLPILEVSLRTGVRVRDFSGSARKQVMSDVSKYKRAAKGDLAYNMMRMWQGAVGVAPADGLVSPAYVVAMPYRQTFTQFYSYLFRTHSYLDQVDSYSRGIVKDRNRLYWVDFKRMPSMFPPLDEQSAIVRFLGYAGRRIEAYIRAKQKLIVLLNEQKQAIIQRAVTRGLDPYVRLKHSGIPWLGDVPENWEVNPFKTKIGFQEGPGIMRADFRDAGIPLLRISCLLSNEDALKGCNYLDPDMVAKKWAHFKVQTDDYLLNASTSASSIMVCKAREPMVGAIPYTGLIRLWPRTSNVNMNYVALLIQSPLIQNQLLLARSGVGITHFGPTHLKRLWIPVPTTQEQEELVEALSLSNNALEVLKGDYLRQIKLALEFRNRLVADVVTGQLDVREAARHLPDDPHEPDDEPEDEEAELADVAEDDPET